MGIQFFSIFGGKRSNKDLDAAANKIIFDSDKKLSEFSLLTRRVERFHSVNMNNCDANKMNAIIVSLKDPWLAAEGAANTAKSKAGLVLREVQNCGKVKALGVAQREFSDVGYYYRKISKQLGDMHALLKKYNLVLALGLVALTGLVAGANKDSSAT